MFCDKLNDILSALDLQNNSEIGRLIGCHPSYISRIRKGDRAPSPSSRGIIKLVQGLCAQAESSGKLDVLALVVGVTPGGQGGQPYQNMQQQQFGQPQQFQQNMAGFGYGMMQCPYCGTQFAQGTRFCTGCGTQLM